MEANIFDSHCHLDRVFQARQRVDPEAFEKFVKSNYKNFGAKFEGCIAVFYDPSRWDPVSACEAKCSGDDLSQPNLIAHSNINLIVVTFHSRKLNFIGDPRIWVTFGCHPKFAGKVGPKEEAKLRQMLKATMPKVRFESYSSCVCSELLTWHIGLFFN
jgi:Tat protein secretion system quality control protein TatD with DNase activity